MEVIDRGTGAPLVLVPGVQGRWEYMGPALDALAERFRVITFPLYGEPASGRPVDQRRGLDALADQIEAVLESRKLQRAAICGVSFGGLVALRFAALRPERTSALILASTPGPGWRLSGRHRLYTRAPWLFGPLFLVETPWRLRAEVTKALPRLQDRWRFIWQQARTLATRPVSPSRMAERSRLIAFSEMCEDGARISVPTLVVTGEPALDRVVSGSTLEFVRLIRGARSASLERTGHLGYITRPDAFARILSEFVSSLQPESRTSAAGGRR